MATPADVARALYDARRITTPIPPLTTTDPTLTVDDAYAIQRELVDLHLADGGSIVGWKLGLTSKPMQQMLGVDEPDYGPVLSSMVFDDGVTVDLDDFIQPKVEAEILLVLGQPLRGPGVTTADAAAAVSGAVAAIEMVDSRIENWKIRLVDTVADLASSAATVKGSRIVPIESDVRLTGMVITKNGATVATGAGAAALGDPIFAVAWLANTLAPYGVTLEPGQFIMTGSLHAAFDVEPGDVVVAEFDRLGTVTMRFKGGAG
jgi:2-keto-4-pentenoate hydratase